MTLAMVLIVLLPFVIIGATLADNINQLTSAAKTWIQNGPPAPPDWLARVPVVGATGDGILARTDGGHRQVVDASAAIHQTRQHLAAPRAAWRWAAACCNWR